MDAIGQSHETRPFLVSRNEQNRKIRRWASQGKHFIAVIFGTFPCSNQEKKVLALTFLSLSLSFFFFFLFLFFAKQRANPKMTELFLCRASLFFFSHNHVDGKEKKHTYIYIYTEYSVRGKKKKKPHETI